MTWESSTVKSAEGLELAVHHWSGGKGSDRPPLLISHATGFHGRAYTAVATALEDQFDCWSFDYRGYGDSEVAPNWQVDWTSYADDALLAIDTVYQRTGAPRGSLLGIGHSMGAATLLIAARRSPGCLLSLVAYEPIIFSPELRAMSGGTNPLADGARRRRNVFVSKQEAIDNFAAKPPLGNFDPVSMHSYVEYGFRSLPDGTIELKCGREHEARTYETGAAHDTWDYLPDTTVRTLVLAGSLRPMQPSSFAEKVAERLPNGSFQRLEQYEHFFPFEQPTEFAAIAAKFLATKGDDHFGSIVTRFDRSVDAIVERLRKHRSLDRVAQLCSRLGDYSVVWYLAGFLRAIGSKDRLREAFIFAGLILAESLVTNQGIKRIFRRERPTVAGDERSPVRQPRTSSFPSGHASSATFAVFALAIWSPWLQVLGWILLAIAIAGSRVYVRIHHASDVVGGIFFGAMMGIVTLGIATLI